MRVLLETTRWKHIDYNCNHVYLMDDLKEKMYAYARFGNPNDTRTFKNPIRINTRGRQFEPVNNIYGWEDPDRPVATDHLKRVVGSQGTEYIVDTVEKTCTCDGFKWRAKCRHIAELDVL